MIDLKCVDEVFVNVEHDFEIEIYKLIGAINSSSVEYDIIEKPMVDLTSMILSERICEKTIESMSEQRRDQPLIYANLLRQDWIIDGNHRLRRRLKDEFKHCQIVVLRNEEIVKFCKPFGNFRTENAYKRWCLEMFS